MDANPGIQPTKLKIGQIINIPKKEDVQKKVNITESVKIESTSVVITNADIKRELDKISTDIDKQATFSAEQQSEATKLFANATKDLVERADKVSPADK